MQGTQLTPVPGHASGHSGATHPDNFHKTQKLHAHFVSITTRHPAPRAKDGKRGATCLQWQEDFFAHSSQPNLSQPCFSHKNVSYGLHHQQRGPKCRGYSARLRTAIPLWGRGSQHQDLAEGSLGVWRRKTICPALCMVLPTVTRTLLRTGRPSALRPGSQGSLLRNGLRSGSL